MTDNPIWRWFDDTFLDLGRQFRWSYLPPLMVYLAAGIQGLTAIVGTFFIKDYLDLSAAFLASLTFWTVIPFTLKMPIGHLVDLIWRRKALLVYFGASLIAVSILMMYGIIAHTEAMAAMLPAEVWFVIATILAPTGYMLQDVVADAMTVEAVPTIDEQGNPYPEATIKIMHTTMQTLGRVAIIGGVVAVSILNITMFEGVEDMSEEMKIDIYANIYLIALSIPVISVMGVILGGVMLRRRAREMEALGHDHNSIDKMLFTPEAETHPNWWILGGSLVFAVFTIGMGVSDIPLAQEIIFVGSMSIILFLMHRLMRELDAKARNMLIGTAIILFVFRATPLPGPGALWFEIDVLKFDQQFLSVLQLIAYALTLLGIIVLRPMMARHSIAFVIVVLTIAAGVLSLPNIGLYYGVHEWTVTHTGGVVDARFIAIMDTALESPLVQISMIPMLAWIAQNAPAHLKATFFAVMASFTNLALSAASLGTKYVNEIFTVTREVRDRVTDVIESTADYSELGWILISVALVGFCGPLLTVFFIQRSRLQTHQ
ncbi:MAG: folate/biopterin family MFS transporter [Gammaproteobacteria bacterium]|nr:folate/biopterin family MFS transporter [Gammaproteobacteria bacterium]